MFHSDLISSIFSAPAWWICRENTGIDLWNDNLAQSGKCSKTKTPTLTEPGWHAGQRAYRMKRRREGNMEKKKNISGKGNRVSANISTDSIDQPDETKAST